MKKNLVIVESPTKASTIQMFLGKDFYVVSSYGHLIDLPEKNIGVNIKKNFQPDYVILPKKRKIVQNLKTLIKNYNLIWLASDEDREGEAIAYQIYKILNIPNEKIRRIVFHEITKKAILDAIKNPRFINYNLVYAQQARRILDRLVGFQLSPILWRKINSGLSAGRVQSAAVRLIVEREQNIQNFIPIPGYQISGIFTYEKKITFHARLDKKVEGEKKMKNILLSCINATFFIKKIITKQEKKSPPPPFTTSTLQQDSCQRLNYSISKTMFLAQKLYEKGYITYIRTDSTNLSKDILSKIKNYVLSEYGKKYLSQKEFLSNRFSQEAHESIHPTKIKKISLENLDLSQKRLYKLIWERTVISQMSDYQGEIKYFYIQSSNLENHFIYTNKTIIFDGFMKIKNKNFSNENDKKNLLEIFKEGIFLQKEEIIAKQIFTKHLPRYNEATLVKNLEKLGIGRPSTYVPIISTIQKRNYVNIQKFIKKTEFRESFLLKKNSITKKKDEIIEIEKNKFIPTEMGILTTNFLKINFQEIVDYSFTASLEKEFDNIAKGKESWNKIIKNFYDGFHKKIEYVKKNVDKIDKKRFLGMDPISNKKVFSKIARFGPIVQMGEFKDKEKPKFSPLLIHQKIDTISLKEALKLLELPKSLGLFEEDEIFLKVNKYNIYIKHKNKSIPIEEKIFFHSFSLEKAINIILINRKKNS
ncbi:type I DNA topoisomerase [Blattabacterium sp. (Cryptocercus kyebangensis)]|uniref:type I DNA topoisomerase n=1 Tax=Blattabacterium sp. (Cryptocercus kyebangensis) TaxID=298656 RepID=UPI000D7D1DBE|nr:type I DNA topoisomerase [Blattabacterium sp. (Cryptocercus kyebangensis)]AWU43727.1 type I DNA topoisomerase [Blattabacterium sp. (Cryptocercus kyebangensis)]